MNKKDVQYILKQLKIRPKKSLGQNFLIDKNTLNKIILESEITKDDVVLEIGPGLGVLTEKLVEKAELVYAVEIEPRFCSYLSKRLSEYDNIEIINADILKINVPFHNKVISNVPYSITGPLLEKIFYKENPPQGTLIIEKSIADRIFFKGNYKKFSRITITLNSFMKPVSKSNISRNCFYPSPNIDLTLIKIEPKDDINLFLSKNENKKFFLKFIAGITPYKNKNIANALELYLKIDKEEIIQILRNNDFDNVKLFSLEIEDFVELSKIFLNSKK